MSDQNTPAEPFEGSRDPELLGSLPPQAGPPQPGSTQPGPPPPSAPSGAPSPGAPSPRAARSGGSILLGLGIGALGGLVSWGMGILAGRATSTAELLTQVLGAVAGIIPIALVVLGIVLSVMPATRRTGAGILLSFGIGILLAGGVCVALLAGVLVN
ncbi:MAG: hypothetical protein K4304_01680 [Propionicimonas sp.]